MSELRINNITDRAGSSGPIIAGVSTVTSTSHMVMPSGPTEMRGGRGRAVFMGSYNMSSPYRSVNMDLIEIATTGDATDFGDLTLRRSPTAVGSATRGVAAGGADPSLISKIDFTTISSLGGANDFGDLQESRRSMSSMGNQTRGLVRGGVISDPATLTNTIESVTIASVGDSSDFGDASVQQRSTGSTANSTRGLTVGGFDNINSSATAPDKIINFLNIQSFGEEQKFGDLFTGGYGISACSSNTRAVFAGGAVYVPSPGSYTESNQIQFVTIATQGNTTDFGDLTEAKLSTNATSNNVRAVIAGGFGDSPLNNATNVIEFITIASTGDAQDFGDLTEKRYAIGNPLTSDSHGGLGD